MQKCLGATASVFVFVKFAEFVAGKPAHEFHESTRILNSQLLRELKAA